MVLTEIDSNSQRHSLETNTVDPQNKFNNFNVNKEITLLIILSAPDDGVLPHRLTPRTINTHGYYVYGVRYHISRQINNLVFAA